MNLKEDGLIKRIELLERRNLRMTSIGVASVLCVAVVMFVGAAQVDDKPGEIKATRIVVVDDQGIPRVVIGQDPKKSDRISRISGITLHDKHGDERGGFGTMDDGSAVMAMDAPVGVGSAMRDRIGLKVTQTAALAFG